MQVASVWGFIGAFYMWFWMLADYFRNGVEEQKVHWGFFLFFGTFVAAIVYFIAIYSRRT